MYGIISDTHCHNWTQFSSVNEDGVNTRLQIILDEIYRAAQETFDAGGEYLIHTGDLFHVRGNIAPSVLNPTLACFKRIADDFRLKMIFICGNHDSEFMNSNDLGSAMTCLKDIGTVINADTQAISTDEETFLFIPWEARKENFLERIRCATSTLKCPEHRKTKRIDIFCHTVLNGAIARIHGSDAIDPQEIIDIVKDACPDKTVRVFSGHIHNHKKLSDCAWSVGAIAHHNWGDIGSKAGFMLVDGDEVTYRASHAPKFIELTKDCSLEDLALMVDCNYVRATVEMSEKEINEFREKLVEYGAKGVTIICHKPEEIHSDRMEIKSAESIESIVSRFIKDKFGGDASTKRMGEIAEKVLGGTLE